MLSSLPGDIDITGNEKFSVSLSPLTINPSAAPSDMKPLTTSVKFILSVQYKRMSMLTSFLPKASSLLQSGSAFEGVMPSAHA